MRRTLIPAALLATALALTGCSASGATSDESGGDQSISLQDAPQAVDAGAPAEGGAAFDSRAGVADTVDGSATSIQRQVITVGTINLTAKDPAKAADEAAKAVEQAGGRIDGRTETAPVDNDGGSATLVMRIPASKLTGTLDAIKKLGTVNSVQIDASDVTQETQDLDARISALKASVDRLVALLAKAKDTKTLIDLETAISGRQGELDSLTSQRRYLAEQVSLSTITLEIGSPATAPVRPATTFFDAVGAGFSGFGAFLFAVLLGIGYALPWLLLVAAGVGIFLLLRRRSRRADVADETASPEPAVAPTD